MLNGSLQSICLLFMAAMGTKISALMVTSMLFITQINQAFLDVVVDAMMVSESRADAESGSQDLQGLSWMLLSIGGILGSVCSAYFTEYLTP